METFAHFLQVSDKEFNDAISPTAPDTPMQGSLRVRKVSALSDFAPVNIKVKK
jgi:hypothetical protein